MRVWKLIAKSVSKSKAPLYDTLRKCMREARVFRISNDAVAPGIKPSESADAFVLPFSSCVYVTDTGYCVILHRASDEPCGVYGEWDCFLLIPAGRIQAVVAGTFKIEKKEKVTIRSKLTYVMSMDRNHAHAIDINTDASRRIASDLGFDPEELFRKNCASAIAFFYGVQKPRNFLLEIDAVAPRKHKASKNYGILPLSARPIYISMEPKEIRKYVGLPEPEPGSYKKKAPHERRAHLRRLTSDRYRWKQGQVVPVKACWIGPASGTTNEGREYRVLLD